MRTLMRPGRQSVLVRIEGRGGTRFVVGGPRAKDRAVFFDFDAALHSFEAIELGVVDAAGIEPATLRV